MPLKNIYWTCLNGIWNGLISHINCKYWQVSMRIHLPSLVLRLHALQAAFHLNNKMFSWDIFQNWGQQWLDSWAEPSSSATNPFNRHLFIENLPCPLMLQTQNCGCHRLVKTAERQWPHFSQVTFSGPCFRTFSPLPSYKHLAFRGEVRFGFVLHVSLAWLANEPCLCCKHLSVLACGVVTRETRRLLVWISLAFVKMVRDPWYMKMTTMHRVAICLAKVRFRVF